MKYIRPLNEKKPKGAPDFHHSDAPDAEGRFRDLGIKDLAAWLIKTRKKDVKKISGSLTQQIVFNRNDDPEYAEKMEKVRKEVYKQLGREDLLDKMDESIDGLEGAKSRLENVYKHLGVEYGQTRRGDKYVQINYIPVSRPQSQNPEFYKVFYDNDKDLKKISKELDMDLKESVNEGLGISMGMIEPFLPVIIGYIESGGAGRLVKKIKNNLKAIPKVINNFRNMKDITRILNKLEKHPKIDGYLNNLDPGGVEVMFQELSMADMKIMYSHLGLDWNPKEYLEIKRKADKGEWANESVLNEEDSYDDYPAAAKKNAQMAIDWKEKYGRDEVPAGTPVGWARAHQLAKGEKISADTVKRMSAFNRHRKNSSIAPEHKDEPWKDNGYVAWLIWGGDEGVDWAIEKSKEIDAMKESKQMKYIKPLHEAKFPGRKGEFIKRGDEYIEIKKTSGSTAYVKFANTASHAFAQVWDDEVTLSDEKHRGKRVWLMESNALNEGYWSGYDYSKWTKENGKPKYPKWVKVTLKEIVKGGFMDPVYDSEHMYMVLWLGSFDNQRRAHLSAYEKKGIKEFGKVGYRLVRDKWNDLTGYNMFFMMGAMYALEVSKQIQDRIANGEPVEPAYYMMKEYFNNFGMDTKRSRIFNAAYEKLEKWMKDNNIKTL